MSLLLQVRTIQISVREMALGMYLLLFDAH